MLTRFLCRKRLSVSDKLLYRQIEDFYYFVDNQDVENYTLAVSNDNAEHLFSVHPLFYTKISWRIIENMNSLLDKKIDDNILKTIVHQSEYIHFYEQLSFPLKLHVKSRIWSIKKHKKGTKIYIRFDYYADNILLATEYSGALLFGVRLKGREKSLGLFQRTKHINAKEVIYEYNIKIAKDLSYRYASKAEIDSPIHTNKQFARSLGLPDIILQGTCTLAKSINLICSNRTEKSKLKSISAKFTGMIIPPNTLSVRILKEDNKSLYFDVLNKDKKAVIKGGMLEWF